MHPDFDHWVEEAVRCFESNGSIRGKNSSKFKSLLQLIVEEWDIDNDEFGVSDEVISQKTRTILRSARDKSTPAQYVRRNKGQLQKELGTEPFTTYTVTFPLNISLSNWDNPRNQFVVQEKPIQKISLAEWKTKYWSSISGRRKTERFLRKSPNNLPSGDFTYWKCQIDAIDQRYATKRASELIELLCAKINLSINYRTSPLVHSSTGPWPYRWSELRPPFIYFVFKEGIHLGFYKSEIYEGYFYSDDPAFREKVRVNNHKIEKLEEILDILPNFQKSPNKIDRVLISGLKRYQKGLIETADHDSFFSYWRGIETMTLTDESEYMSEIPKRAGALFEPDDPDVFEYRLERVKTLRNELVHEGQTPRIQEEDLKILKNVLGELIFLFIEFREVREIDDLRFILDKGGNNQVELDELKSNHHREIYLINQFLKG